MKKLVFLVLIIFYTSLALAQAASLPSAMSSIAAPVVSASPTATPVPLLFAFQDTTSGVTGPITGVANVAVNDSITFLVSGATVPVTLSITVNGNPVTGIAVPSTAIQEVTINGTLFRKLGTLIVDQPGQYQVSATAPGFTANSLVIQGS